MRRNIQFIIRRDTNNK